MCVCVCVCVCVRSESGVAFVKFEVPIRNPTEM